MSRAFFDAHCDTLSLLGESASLRKNDFCVDLESLALYSPSSQVFAIWSHGYDKLRGFFYDEMSKNSDIAVHCKSVKEARAAHRENKVACFLSVEGAELLDCSVERLERAATEDGICMINLCWNHDNALCGAAADSGSGLTEQGRAFVRAMKRFGVLVDLSHASERTFWDVFECTDDPVIASHSNSATLCGHTVRNLTDAQFKRLVGSSGGAGINLYTNFLGGKADIPCCVAHIEHFLSLGGEHSIFLGCDFDGADSFADGMRGIRDMDKLRDELLRRNHSERLVEDIFFNNLTNIMERVR